MISSTDGVLKEIDSKLESLQEEFSVIETDLANLQKRREQVRGEYTSLLNLRQKIAGNSNNDSEENCKCEDEECVAEVVTTCEEGKFYDEKANEIPQDDPAVEETAKVEKSEADTELPKNIVEVKHEEEAKLSEEEARKIEEIKKLQKDTPEYLQ